jgi:hypothetical protein
MLFLLGAVSTGKQYSATPGLSSWSHNHLFFMEPKNSSCCCKPSSTQPRQRFRHKSFSVLAPAACRKMSAGNCRSDVERNGFIVYLSPCRKSQRCPRNTGRHGTRTNPMLFHAACRVFQGVSARFMPTTMLRSARFLPEDGLEYWIDNSSIKRSSK